MSVSNTGTELQSHTNVNLSQLLSLGYGTYLQLFRFHAVLIKESLQQKKGDQPKLRQKKVWLRYRYWTWTLASLSGNEPGLWSPILSTPLTYSLWAAARASSCLDSVHCMKESLQPKRWTAHNCTLLEVFQQTIFLLMDYPAISGHEGSLPMTWVGQFRCPMY